MRSDTEPADAVEKPGRIDGHRTTEFIYGTAVALVAVAGIDATDVAWLPAFALVVMGGAAIWLTHVYSTLMSGRITNGSHRTTRGEVRGALIETWPIVAAALVVAVPFLGVGLSLFGMQTALNAATVIGGLILVLVGVVIGVATHETWPRTIVLVLLSGGLGLSVVLVETAIHH